VTSWYGVLGPARIAAPVVGRLNAAVTGALQAPEVRQQMARQGLEPIGTTPGEFAAHLKREVARWARVVRDAGIKAN
jgi:tripartite-type tricarboxylate transporter receptor subunit TctC